LSPVRYACLWRKRVSRSDREICHRRSINLRAVSPGHLHRGLARAFLHVRYRFFTIYARSVNFRQCLALEKGSAGFRASGMVHTVVSRAQNRNTHEFGWKSALRSLSRDLATASSGAAAPLSPTPLRLKKFRPQSEPRVFPLVSSNLNKFSIVKTASDLCSGFNPRIRRPRDQRQRDGGAGRAQHWLAGARRRGENRQACSGELKIPSTVQAILAARMRPIARFAPGRVGSGFHERAAAAAVTRDALRSFSDNRSRVPKNVLCQVDIQCPNLHLGPPSLFVVLVPKHPDPFRGRF
jgi:hypothetical protein